MSPLEKELETALLDLYEQWKKYVQHPKNRFLRMVRFSTTDPSYKGPVQTVRHLLTGVASLGFDDIVQVKKPELTVEWLVLHPKWLPLFTDQELDVARARIRKVSEPSQTLKQPTIKT